jgi:clan AA aspartic protease (TIGR02281 family)
MNKQVKVACAGVKKRRAGYALALALGAATIAPASSSIAGALYRCEDNNGKVSYQDHKCPMNDKQFMRYMEEKVKEATKGAGVGMSMPAVKEILVTPDPIDHVYRVRGGVNGVSTAMMVDTGASYLSIPKSLAAKAGITCGKTTPLESSSGMATACFATAREVRLEHLVLPDVPIIILPVDNGTILLGQSVLNRLKVVQEAGLLRLSVPVAAAAAAVKQP